MTDTTKIAIHVKNISKCFHIYERPNDRLKQSILPKLQKLAGKVQKKYFREFWAIRDVNFSIQKGEAVGIIGQNGSGKSTLLQMICNTLNPTSGEIKTHGRIAGLLELGTGFNPEFTGRENVYLNAALFGLTKEDTNERFDEIASFADIGEFIDQPVRTYSSGMYVRLAFAVIAHVDADLLIIDEALAVGDAIFVQKCMRYIRNFQKSGTLLFVSHSSQAVLDICDKAIWLDNGKLMEFGVAKNVCSSYAAFVHGCLNKKTKIKIERNDDERFCKENKSVSCRDKNECLRNEYESNHTKYVSNTIELFGFKKDASWWGKGGAEITNICIESINGNELKEIKGGEEIVLKIVCRAKETLRNPIVGFALRNYRGLEIFTDNTFLFIDDPPEIFPNEIFSTIFRFQMPLLAAGEYVIGAAIADGTQIDFVQHQRKDDALFVKVHPNNAIHGIIGMAISDCIISKSASCCDSKRD